MTCWKIILDNAWIGIKTICFVALLVNMSLKVYSSLYPDITVSKTDMTTMDKMNFPAVFKVCMQPSFDSSELKEVGYLDARAYFAGQSMYSSSTYGWAGHTREGTPFSNASDVQQRIFLDYHSVINSSQAFIRERKNTRKLLVHPIPASSFKLRRPNYPNNCLVLDITAMPELQRPGESIMAMSFAFNPNKFATEIEIKVEDRHNLLGRSDLLTKDKFIGPTPWTDQFTKRLKKTYMISFKQDIFYEENQQKNCADYPTKEYATYDVCDQHVLEDLLKNDSIYPAWAHPEDLSKATKISNSSTLSLNAHLFYHGFLSTPCSKPCIETSIHSTYGNTVPNIMGTDGTAQPTLTLMFNPNVEVTKHFYPRYDYNQFLLDLGSCSGLWLGLSVAHALEAAIMVLLNRVQNKFNA